MAIQCEHNSKLRLDGLCAKCKALKPYMVFRFNPDCHKEQCNCCGYFWGPGNEKFDGQPARWSQ